MAFTNAMDLPDLETGESGKSILSESDLKEGEFLCDVCNGTGQDPNQVDNGYFWTPVCPKCQGEKKLDWVSIATGIKPKEYNYGGLSSSSGCSGNMFGGTSGSAISTNLISSKLNLNSDVVEVDGKGFQDYIMNLVAEHVAVELDKQILEIFNNTKEQKTKKRRGFFDNRIFSKLLFYCNFKQRVKNKKDKTTL